MKNQCKSLLFLATSMVLFVSCQSTSVKTSAVVPHFYDQGFNYSQPYEVETEQEVFYLDHVAEAYVRQIVGPVKGPKKRMQALVSAVFDRSKMNLLYRGDANTLANETFHNRAANCLSLSIMMYALAKEARFDVEFQEIVVPEYWTRRAGYSLLNGHINLRLSVDQPEHAQTIYKKTYQVDFDPQSSRAALDKKVVSKKSVLAMFYNNKGADALLKSDFNQAYAYFKAALSIKPSFHSAWINLGILYRHNQLFEQAEEAYNYALHLEPDSLTAWENLAHLYKFTGRLEQADSILAKVEYKRKNNPFYHVNLGEEQIEQKNWNQALVHFRKALTLDRNKHEIYYGLAQVYMQKGELQQSERYLKLALNNAKNDQLEKRYQSQINLLQTM